MKKFMLVFTMISFVMVISTNANADIIDDWVNSGLIMVKKDIPNTVFVLMSIKIYEDMIIAEKWHTDQANPHF